MQYYTRKMLQDIKLTHEKRAKDKLSEVGPHLISGGNSSAYNRKFIELHANALENIVKDIFECEKKALSRVTAFPRSRYFSTLKKEVLDIVNPRIHQLNEKLKNLQQPYIVSPATKVFASAAPLDSLQSSIHDQINRAADQLQEEINLKRISKVKFWLEIVSLPAVIGLIEYLTGWIRSIFWFVLKSCGLG